jgi:hypothetical protein
MTETQAKSGAAGASTEPTRNTSQPATDAPETTGGEVNEAAAKEAGEGTDVIRRPAAAASGGSSEQSEATTAGSGDTGRPVTFPPASSTPTTSTPAGAAADADSAPTRRMLTPEPTVRTPQPAPGTNASRVAAPTSSTGTTTVGRAPVVPGSPARTAARGSGPTVRGMTGAVTGAAAVGAARVSETFRSARATVAGAATRGPRRARLHLKRIDPWSVMKFAFAVSLVLFVVAVVATSVLYLALDAMNVFSSVNKAFTEITGGGSSSNFKITAKGVIGTAILLGAVNMVLFTALSTLGAFVYNVCADLVGGIEVTLAEKE